VTSDEVCRMSEILMDTTPSSGSCSLEKGLV
jgi:hypothetical protein